MRFILSLAALVALTPIAAHADEWCGFETKAGSQVRCGFSSLPECKQALHDKKDVVCMPDPTFVERRSRVTVAANRD
ncbi:MAG TPA: hypothetical protein VHD14_00280 [Pseudolabrys sp.]|nr:hypothetical protein [Pseudolabrys sp.]